MHTKKKWRAKEIEQDESWIYEFGASERRTLRDALRQVVRREDLLDYRKSDFDLGSAGTILQDALAQVKTGRGIAMLRGLPREDLSESEFELLTWMLGLHAGVARPQGIKTQYISPVRDVGTDYRSSGGRGYSSNARLDHHTDSADLVFLSCYNRAKTGGISMTTNTLAAYDEMERSHPDLIRWLSEPVHFSRQGEHAPDEGPTCAQPVYGEIDGRLVSRWNWNRVNTALKIQGVPPLHPEQRKALETYDEIVQMPELIHDFWMEPGDVQIVNSHVTLHSRTAFADHNDAPRKRLMFRLWIAPPDSQALPVSWRELYRHVEPGVVRGGIRGQGYTARCEQFERIQAADTGVVFLS